jgi:hypothetical protein
MEKLKGVGGLEIPGAGGAELVAAAKTGDVRATRALARLEQVNPAALTTFLTKG